MKIAVFASGRGSNFEAIVKATRDGRLTEVDVALLICDKPGALVVEKAKSFSIPTFVFDPKSYPDKPSFEKVIVERLQEAGVEFIVLAGYMRLVGDVLLGSYENRMINLHPSLLPAFPGKDTIRQAYDYGVKVTGVTVHFVDAGLDSGPIIRQIPVPIQDEDTVETLTERIHLTEHDLLVSVLQDISVNSIQLNGRKVTKRI